MSDAAVTREHRLRAYRTYYGIAPSPLNSDHVRWVENGVCFWSPSSQFCMVDKVADALAAVDAAGEKRGREAERADVLTRLRSALAEYQKMQGDVRQDDAKEAQDQLSSAFGLNVSDFVQGQADGASGACELLIEEFERGEHVGKAGA